MWNNRNKMSKRTYSPTYEPLSSQSREKKLSKLSFLTASPGSFQSIDTPVTSPKRHNKIDISDLDQIAMANKLKALFMKNKGAFNEVPYPQKANDGILHKFNISKQDFQKNLVNPTTLLNIMTRLEHLRIGSMVANENSSHLYKTYSSSKCINHILNIVDTIGIKVLYLINHNNTLYLSPLNIRYARDFIRKISDKKYTDINKKFANVEFMTHINDDLSEKFKTTDAAEVDASAYDIIMMTSSFEAFEATTNKVSVNLIKFDMKDDYKSSILDETSQDDVGHLISFNKCYNYTMVNTSWRPFNIYSIDNFMPGKKTFYYIDSNKNLKEVSEEDAKSKKYYFSHFVQQYTFYVSLNNMHFFSSSISDQSSVSVGGGITHLQTIPEVSVCSDVYFPNNKHGFCWFAAIINSFFFADDISIKILDRSVSHMQKTLNYVENFYDRPFYLIKPKDMKIYIQHVTKLFTYIYCSFSMLSKNQLNMLKNQGRWYNIYRKITEEYYNMIYVFLIICSKRLLV